MHLHWKHNTIDCNKSISARTYLNRIVTTELGTIITITVTRTLQLTVTHPHVIQYTHFTHIPPRSTCSPTIPSITHACSIVLVAWWRYWCDLLRNYWTSVMADCWQQEINEQVPWHFQHLPVQKIWLIGLDCVTIIKLVWHTW